jgi:hypothetical protein
MKSFPLIYNFLNGFSIHLFILVFNRLAHQRNCFHHPHGLVLKHKAYFWSFQSIFKSTIQLCYQNDKFNHLEIEFFMPPVQSNKKLVHFLKQTRIGIV